MLPAALSAALLTSPLSSETVYLYVCPHTTTHVSSYAQNAATELQQRCNRAATELSSLFVYIWQAENKEEANRSERSSERCNRAATELQQSFPHSLCVYGRLKTRRRKRTALSVAQNAATELQQSCNRAFLTLCVYMAG
jgi:hypothetical protein